MARKTMSSPPVRFASLAEAMEEMEKKDQDACGAVAQGGRAAGRAGAEEFDGV